MAHVSLDSPLLLMLLLLAVSRASGACMVNNMTASAFADSRSDVTYFEDEDRLVCAQRTHASCYGADIQGCSIVECRGRSSCRLATIQGTGSTLVNCTMKNACLQAQISIQSDEDEQGGDSSINCQGDYSCYLSRISVDSGAAAAVTCNGYRACYSSDAPMILDLENSASNSRTDTARQEEEENAVSEDDGSSKVICSSDHACENIRITASCLQCSTDKACHYLCGYKEGSSSSSWNDCASSMSEDCGN